MGRGKGKRKGGLSPTQEGGQLRWNALKKDVWEEKSCVEVGRISERRGSKSLERGGKRKEKKRSHRLGGARKRSRLKPSRGKGKKKTQKESLNAPVTSSKRGQGGPKEQKKGGKTRTAPHSGTFRSRNSYAKKRVQERTRRCRRCLFIE